MAASAQALQSGRSSELLPRLLFVLGAIIVFRVGSFIPVPGVDPNALAQFFEAQQGTILSALGMLSGGALERLSIFALGVMPYISASIIMQLLTVVVPQLEELKKEGEAGRRKINQYTRYGAVILAIFQSVGAASALQSQAGIAIVPGPSFVFNAAVTLVAGTIFLMWLGEQITERGIGNGISLIIFAGIVSGLPSAIGRTAEMVSSGELNGLLALGFIALII
ncbi:MAG: preprotein translocase subunit SecY, partial [Gammaproteobacteria bacterium]